MTDHRLAMIMMASLCLTALSACTGTPAQDSAATSAPSQSEPAAPSETDTAQASPSASPSTEVDVAVADSCLSIDTTELTVDGATLGACFSDALHAIGTMRAQQVSGGETQEAEIRLRPDVAIHGTGADSDVIFVDGIAYRNDGDGWTRGEPDSEDPDEVTIGQVGLLLVAVFAGDILQQSIAACADWNIEPGTSRITLPDDEVVETRVFRCAAAFDSLGMTIDPMQVWIGEDWTPYGHESTATGFGQIVGGASYYYDHGIEVEIIAPI